LERIGKETGRSLIGVTAFAGMDKEKPWNTSDRRLYVPADIGTEGLITLRHLKA
jgi:hypothetical protein